MCVFCGSNPGTDPAYADAAIATGRRLAERGVRIVYGGGAVGLMGRMSSAAMEAGGEVVGVIPDFLEAAEVGARDITELHVTETMHERKALMSELSDAFLALPGGIGTFEEAFEVMTWTQLGIHDKPIALVDVNGFYAPAAALLDRAVADGFLAPEVRAAILVVPTADAALDGFATWERPAIGKWTERPVTVEDT